MIPKGYEMPDDLDELSRAAYAKIMDVLRAADDPPGSALWAGGARVFYSPAEWAARGERYGLGSRLIITYDGGAHRRFFTLDEMDYPAVERMRASLEEIGVYFEECTGWYAAVWPI